MRRPKKKKIELVEEEPKELDESEETTCNDPAASSHEEVHAAEAETGACVETSADVPMTPIEREQVVAEAAYLAECEVFVEAEKQQKKADAAYDLAVRIAKAKMNRLEANVKRAAPTSAWKYIEKWYMWELEVAVARSKALMAPVIAAEQSERATRCLVNTKTLEINRLRRELRSLKKRKNS